MAEIYYHPFGEEPGLLLLDFFAAEAMKAFIINRGSVQNYNLEDGNMDNDKLSAASYALAENMLKYREFYLEGRVL